MYDIEMAVTRLAKGVRMKYKSRNCISGFTLIELIMVILILGVLAAVAVPMYIGYVDKARAANDNTSLSVLNDATRVYYAEEPSPNPFKVSGTSSDSLMQTLVDAGLLSEIISPEQNRSSFQWNFSSELWLLSSTSELSASEITLGTGGHSGYIKGSYTGTQTDITIPKVLDGVTITNIYQDVFSGKGLTSVSFTSGSSITRIHARAFMNNKLTEIVLPSSLQIIDYGAFLNNNITKITIGSNVAIAGNAFQNNNSFRDVYNAQGAGTYIYTDGQWVKQ